MTSYLIPKIRLVTYAGKNIVELVLILEKCIDVGCLGFYFLIPRIICINDNLLSFNLDYNFGQIRMLGEEEN